ESVEGPCFRVVDATKPVGLHQSVPDAPEENYQQNSFQVPPEEGGTNGEKKQGREDKAPLEAFEQSTIAIGPDHPWQVMPHCAKRRDEKINVLRPPPRLGQGKNRHQQKRGGDVQDEVAPGIEYPQLPLRHAGRRSWNSLQT